jgi:Ca2+-binding RTX toxin-like protein
VADNVADSDGDGGEGGGVQHTGAGALTLRNTLVGNNRDGSTGPGPKSNDCQGAVTSQGYNLVEDPTGCTGLVATDITGQNPQIGALTDNGGPTDTHAPRRQSPAVDAGNPAAPGSGGAACETNDQRGANRPQGPRCDIGSVELRQPSEIECLGHPVTITGTNAADIITGTRRRDVILAFGGDDVVTSLGGPDRVCAGLGNDRVKGGPGNDLVAGQAGNDRLIGSGDDDQLRGQGGRDRLKGKGGNDTLRGGPKPDRLNGGGGFDICRGGGGRDVLRRCERRS